METAYAVRLSECRFQALYQPHLLSWPLAWPLPTDRFHTIGAVFFVATQGQSSDVLPLPIPKPKSHMDAMIKSLDLEIKYLNSIVH